MWHCTGTFSDGGRPYSLLSVNLYERQFKGRRLLEESFKVAFHLSHRQGEFQILDRDTNAINVMIITQSQHHVTEIFVLSKPMHMQRVTPEVWSLPPARSWDGTSPHPVYTWEAFLFEYSGSCSPAPVWLYPGLHRGNRKEDETRDDEQIEWLQLKRVHPTQTFLQWMLDRAT